MADAATQAAISAGRTAQEQRSCAQRIELRQGLMERDSERGNAEDLWEEVIRYARPDLSPTQAADMRSGGATEKGEKRGEYIFSSKPVTAAEQAADALVGNVFSRRGWFGYTFPEVELNEVDEVQAWLQDCRDAMTDHYETSNWHSMLPGLALDTLTLGNPLVYCGNPKRGIGRPFFKHISQLEAYWQRDYWGRLIAVHVLSEMTALEAYEKWGEACSAALCRAAYSEPFKSFRFVHAVYKTGDSLLEGVDLPLEARRPFVEFYIERGSDKNQFSAPTRGGMMTGILQSGGYWTQPFADWPYFLRGNETYGRGPLGTGIGSIKRLHIEYQSVLDAAQREAAQPLVTTEKNRALDIQMQADGVTYVGDLDRDAIVPLYKRPGNYPFGKDLVERSEAEIEKMLHLPFFLMMTMAQKQMTIPEFSHRAGEQAAALIGRIGLVQPHLLEPIHDRMWQIHAEVGRLPPPPPIVQDLYYTGRISGKVIIRYTGPLARAYEDKNIRDRVLGPLATVNALAAFDPEGASDVLNVPVGVERVLDEGGFYQDAIRGVNSEQFKARQRMRLVAQAAQLQAQVDKDSAQASKSGAEAEKVLNG